MTAASQQPHSLQDGLLSDDKNYTQLADLNFDLFEVQTLEIARYFFYAFAEPESEAWIEAFRRAEMTFPAPFGATIANAILIALNDMGAARTRPFSFVNPGCKNCGKRITDEERYLLSALQNTRRGHRSTAETACLLLCEGGDSSALIASLERIAIITGDIQTPSGIPLADC